MAATRAADFLIVPVSVENDKGGGLMKKLLPHLPPLDDDTRGRDVERVHVLDPFQLPALVQTSSPRQDEITDNVVTHARDTRERWKETRASLLSRSIEGRRVVTASSQENWEHAGWEQPGTDVFRADTPVERNLGLRIGNALHGAMESIDIRRHHSLDDVVRGLVESALDDADIASSDTGSRERVFRMVERALQSDLLNRARSADELVQEVEFGYGIADGGMIQGQMDVVFVEDGGIIIGDFKSDNIQPGYAESRVEQHYGGQAAVYAYAAHQVTELPVREVVFYFAETGESVAFDGAALFERGQRIATTSDSADVGAEPDNSA